MNRCKSCAYLQNNLVPRLKADVSNLQVAVDAARRGSGLVISHEIAGQHVVVETVGRVDLDKLGRELASALGDVKLTRDELELATYPCTCGLQLGDSAEGGESV